MSRWQRRGSCGSVRRQLAVEDGAAVEDRQTLREAADAGRERRMTQPVAPFALPVSRLNCLVGQVGDEAADAVDVRLDGPAVGVLRDVGEDTDAGLHDGPGTTGSESEGGTTTFERRVRRR